MTCQAGQLFNLFSAIPYTNDSSTELYLQLYALYSNIHQQHWDLNVDNVMAPGQVSVYEEFVTFIYPVNLYLTFQKKKINILKQQGPMSELYKQNKGVANECPWSIL